MLSSYFGIAPVPSWILAVAIVAGLHGAFVAAYTAWVAALVRRRAAHPLLLAGGWVACEFARATVPLGAPWALTAYSQMRWTALIQSADLAGPYLVGFLVAAVNACVAAVFAPPLRGRRPHVSSAITALAVAGTLLYGEWRLRVPFGEGAPVSVAVVQGGATPAERTERPARLARYVALTRTAVAPDTQLVVWPEYATEAYLEEPSPTRSTILRTAEEQGVDLVLGGPHFEGSQAGTRYHNSAYLIRAGRLAGRYDKHRLVPVAEDDRLLWLIGAMPSGYTPGRGSFVLPGSTLPIGTLLCMEAMTPDVARRAVGDGAEILVTLSNDAWFGGAGPARQQLDMAALRAVESRRYLVRAAATGYSAVIDPYGRERAISAFDTYEVLNAPVRAARGRSPYHGWGDAFAWLVIAMVAITTLRQLLQPIVTRNQRRFS